MTHTTATRKVGDILLDKGLITKEQLQCALDIQKNEKDNKKIVFLGAILLREQFVKEEDLFPILKAQVDETRVKKNSWILASLALKKVIGEAKYTIASNSLQQLGKTHVLEVLDANDYIKFANQKEFICDIFKPYLQSIKVIDCSKITVVDISGQDVYCEVDGQSYKLCFVPDLNVAESQGIVSYQEYTQIKNGELNKNKQPTGDLLNSKDGIQFSISQVLSDAIRQKASDIHIVYGAEDYKVFFRIGGNYKRQIEYTTSLLNGRKLVSSLLILASSDTKGKFSSDEKRKPQDAKIVVDNTDLRISFIPDGNLSDVAATIRVLERKTLNNPSLLKLGYFQEDIEVIERASSRRGGLIVVSGITNSGKSTLVANVLAKIENKKIMTIEDPIEIRHSSPWIIQHQTYIPEDDKLKVGFAEYVKAAKRADTDVILIGEIRNDHELISAAMEAAEAGQTVFTTIHVTSAFNIYAAFHEMLKVSYFVSSTRILFSLNQTLVPRLCDNCKEQDFDNINGKNLNAYKDDLPYSKKDTINDILNNTSITYKKGNGCEKCKNSGYSGLTPIYEFVYPTVEFMEYIASTKPTRFELEREAIRLGIGKNKLMIFIEKLKKGEIDADPNTIQKIL